jgi:hypothetical protein
MAFQCRLKLPLMSGKGQIEGPTTMGQIVTQRFKIIAKNDALFIVDTPRGGARSVVSSLRKRARVARRRMWPLRSVGCCLHLSRLQAAAKIDNPEFSHHFRTI